MVQLALSDGRTFEPILNRLESETQVEKHLGLIIDALQDLVDYGTFLVPRCWTSSSKNIRDIVALAVLLKQVVGQLDAATVLLKKGCVEPTLLQLRAAFEASVYCQWVLDRKTLKRATAYYVWNVRRAIRWNRRALKGTPEFRHIAKEMAGLKMLNSFATTQGQSSLKSEIQRLEGHLASKKYQAWNTRFAKLRGKRPHDPDWYQVLFRKRRSFYWICTLAKRLPEYRVIYEIGSEAMHGARSDAHFHIPEPGKLALISLRELTDFGFVSQMLIGVALKTYRAVLSEYRPAESENFARKYVENWKRPFFTKVNVDYRYEYRELS